MSVRITEADVAHVARLARLELSGEELHSFTEQLGAILDYAEEIQALDTENVAPTAHPIALQNVLRRDVVGRSLSADEALANAPARRDDRFLVPRILGEPA